jgi:tetrahydromethanopterin S-methyltransferase subunit G
MHIPQLALFSARHLHRLHQSHSPIGNEPRPDAGSPQEALMPSMAERTGRADAVLKRLDSLKETVNTRFDTAIGRATEHGRDDLVTKLEARRDSVLQHIDQVYERIESRPSRIDEGSERFLNHISARVDDYLNVVSENISGHLTARAASARENGQEELAVRLETKADRIASVIDHLANLIGQHLDRIGGTVYGQNGEPAPAVPADNATVGIDAVA